MKVYKNSKDKTRPQRAQILLILVCAAASVGCESLNNLERTSYSALPVTKVAAAGGSVVSATATESASDLVVAGSVKRHALTAPPEVRVELLDREGGVVAAESDKTGSVHPRLARAHGDRFSYSVRFPQSVARQAASIRVTCRAQANR